MEPSLVAEALAAHPDGGRVTAAAVVGCICLDHLACVLTLACGRLLPTTKLTALRGCCH